MRRLALVVFLAVPLILVLIRCGAGGDASVVDNSFAIPAMAIASPLASDSTRETHMVERDDEESEVKPFAKVKEELKDILKAETPAACFADLGFKTFNKPLLCYGPVLVVENHPDGNFTSGSPCPPGVSSPTGAPGSNDGCLPSGDAGMWTATEGATTEACGAAKANELVGDVAVTINKALKFMAAMTCVSEIAGKALPAEGTSLDLKAEVEAGFTGATVTTATITRKPDYTGTTDPVYELVLEAAVSGKSFKITLVNSTASADKFRGRIYGYHSVGVNQYRGFSALYEQSSTTDLRVVSRMGITPTSAGTALYTADGDYDFAVWSGIGGAQNARYLFANLDPSTGLGTFNFSWQAGTIDAFARTFQATASRSGGADAGYAYFGFGPDVADVSVGTIGGMCCSWAGPATAGADCMEGTLNTTDRQGQSFSRSVATDPFTPTASFLLYAPVKVCSSLSGTNPTFKVGTLAQWGTNGSLVSVANIAETLLPPDFLGAIPGLVAPTFAP